MVLLQQLSYRNFRVRVTQSGWLFILLCLGIGVSALNTGNNLLYLIFGTMLAFLILSGLLSNNSLRRLQIQPTFPHRIFAKQPVMIQFDLHNRKRVFPSFGIQLKAEKVGKAEIGGTFVIKIDPKNSTSTSDQLQFMKRGRASLPTYVAQTSYPFGLIEKTLRVPSQGETIVYPEIRELDDWIGNRKSLQGEYLSGEKGGTSNPYGIRDYVMGDPARLIHWKTSAKQEKWKVKEFEMERRLRVLLDVPLAPIDQSNPEMLERALSVAASMLVLLSQREMDICLRINEEVLDDSGRGSLDSYLTALALARPPASARNGIPHVEASNVITISDLPDHRLSGDIVFGSEKLKTL